MAATVRSQLSRDDTADRDLIGCFMKPRSLALSEDNCERRSAILDLVDVSHPGLFAPATRLRLDP
jgi:hypothetical protein